VSWDQDDITDTSSLAFSSPEESSWQLMSAIEKCAENTGNLMKMTDNSKPSDIFFDYVKACARQLPKPALDDELTEDVLQRVNKKAKSLAYQPTPMPYQYPLMQPPV
jgi:hypothetical protein